MIEVNVGVGDEVRVGGAWPTCLDAKGHPDGVLAFFGMMVDNSGTASIKRIGGVQLRTFEREFVVILMPYPDSEIPDEYKWWKTIFSYRPKSWPKEAGDGAE